MTVTLHPEVKVDVTVNIARTEDEAKTQLKTGKALIADQDDEAPSKEEVAQEAANESKAELMEADALEAEKEAQAKAAEKLLTMKPRPPPKQKPRPRKKPKRLKTTPKTVNPPLKLLLRMPLPKRQKKKLQKTKKTLNLLKRFKNFKNPPVTPAAGFFWILD